MTFHILARKLGIFSVLTQIFFFIYTLDAGARNHLEITPVNIPEHNFTSWMVQDKTLPLISVIISFRNAGYAHDPSGKNGLVALMASLMDQGAGKLPREVFQNKLYDHSITLSFQPGIDTFTITLKTLDKHKMTAMDMLSDVLWAPHFRDEDISRSKNAMINHLMNTQDRPSVVANKTLMEMIFPNHPYSHQPEGTIKGLQGVERKDLYAFLKSRFARDNMVVSVVGDVDYKEVQEITEVILRKLPARSVSRPLFKPVLSGEGQTKRITSPGVSQSVIYFAQEMIQREHPSFLKAAVMNEILGGGAHGSWLFEEVREKRGLVYGVYTSLAPLDMAGLIVGQAQTAPKNMVPTKAEIIKAWNRMSTTGPTPEDVDKAKKSILGSLALELNDTTSIALFLNAVQIHRLGLQYLEERQKIIENITPEDIKAFARDYLKPESLRFVIVGPDV